MTNKKCDVLVEKHRIFCAYEIVLWINTNRVLFCLVVGFLAVSEFNLHIIKFKFTNHWA